MPRSARLDAPGVLHHIMIRGIERRPIFKSDEDREDLLERLSTLLPETKTACYAWALLPNHAHFLFRSGPGGIPLLMRRLLTGYAVSFNRRHRRHGQLFQNRYKSILCQEEPYLHCKEAGNESAGSGIRCEERGSIGRRAPLSS